MVLCIVSTQGVIRVISYQMAPLGRCLAGLSVCTKSGGNTDVIRTLTFLRRDVACHQRKRRERWTVKWSCQGDGKSSI